MQGGSGLPFLSDPVYTYKCTGKCTEISISNEQVPDQMLRFLLEKVWQQIVINALIYVLTTTID